MPWPESHPEPDLVPDPELDVMVEMQDDAYEGDEDATDEDHEYTWHIRKFDEVYANQAFGGGRQLRPEGLPY